MSVSQTIVRQVRGGGDPASHRFIILAETEIPPKGFRFTQTGIEMTTGEVCATLVAHGVSEGDALALLKEAASSFAHV